MDTVRRLRNVYRFANAYKERYIGGVVPSWTEYIKGKRIYKGESQREFMMRLSRKYEDDIRNDKILNKLDAIQQSIAALVEKISTGQPVSVRQLSAPISELSQMPPPPPPPPPPMQPQRPKKEMTEKEIKQASTRDQMMDELKQRLAKRGVIASGGRSRRRNYNF